MAYGRGRLDRVGRREIKFFVVGEGPLREPLEQQARALNLGERFVFAGFAKDVARVVSVSAFDVSVFPSLWEGTPLTVFEALAMGKAIVATDADGLVDVLTHEKDAIIVPKRDAPALAAGLIRRRSTSRRHACGFVPEPSQQESGPISPPSCARSNSSTTCCIACRGQRNVAACSRQT